MSDLPPVGPELGRVNRRILAERLNWPAGAAEACEKIDDAHPGWASYWTAGNDWSGSEMPEPGYYAARDGRRKAWQRIPGDPPGHEPLAYGSTPEELAGAIESWPWRERDTWKLESLAD